MCLYLSWWLFVWVVGMCYLVSLGAMDLAWVLERPKSDIHIHFNNNMLYVELTQLVCFSWWLELRRHSGCKPY